MGEEKRNYINELKEMRDAIYREQLEDSKSDAEAVAHIKREYDHRSSEDVADELFDILLDSIGG